MKKTVPAKKMLSRLSSVMMAALLTAIIFSSAKASPATAKKTLILEDSIVINKLSANKNFNIELSQGNSPRKIFISVIKHQKKTYHFYMFDAEGNLKAQVDILNNEKLAFVNIEKGSYYYEILCNDERVENGQLTVK